MNIKFKDLPSYKELVLKYAEYYTYFSKNLPIYLQQSKGFFAFEDFPQAYAFLKHNPEYEVSDAFYGSNFPFLRGNHIKNYYNSYFSKIEICLTEKKFPFLLDDISDKCDFNLRYNTTMDHNEDFDKFIEESHEKGLYVSYMNRVSNKFYFATKNYEEILERFSVLRIMTI